MLTFTFHRQISIPQLDGEFLKGKDHASHIFKFPVVPGTGLISLTAILPFISP